MRRGGMAIVCLAGALLLAPGALADEIQALIGIYGAENATGYLQPLADALGADMNGGFYHTARLPARGLHFYLGVETIAAPIANDALIFTAHTEDPFSPPATLEAPTVFGAGEGPVATGTGGTAFIFPGGMDMSRLPLAVPQLTVGSIMGSEATVRFVDVELGDSIKKLRLLGIGVRHSLSQYLPGLPVDLAAGGYWQSFKVEDLIEAKTLSLGVQGSIATGPLTAYAGIAHESATLDVSYPRGTGSFAEPIAFSMDGKNSMRVTVGLALQILVLNLHADYSLASQSTLAAGVGLGR